MAEAARATIRVTGVVQGVGYRAATVDEARRLGLRGAVRNLPDGRVEVVAEGPRERVESLLAWCWRGPPLARVSAVEAAWGPPQGGPAGFHATR